MIRSPRPVFRTIATSGERFADFAPFVASINDAGQVAFQATLRDGGTGFFSGHGETIAAPGPTAAGLVARFTSHPDIDASGRMYGYAVLKGGGEGLVVIGDGAAAVVDTRGPLSRIGPLGPTVTDDGSVAFRASLRDGGSAVLVVSAGSIATIAASGRFTAFHGLPVINDGGQVVFRADTLTGQGIYLLADRLREVVTTGERFRELGQFPSLADDGTVAFTATARDGSSGVFTWRAGQVTAIATSGGAIASFRGALISPSGRLFYYATAAGGALSIHAADAPDPAILALGDPLEGSAVAELALNPVSVNRAGQLAIRVKLADARQLIVRADPAGS